MSGGLTPRPPGIQEGLDALANFGIGSKHMRPLFCHFRYPLYGANFIFKGGDEDLCPS